VVEEASIADIRKAVDEGKLNGFGFAYEQATKLRKPSSLLPALPISQ
jgi:hypothetical protein